MDKSPLYRAAHLRLKKSPGRPARALRGLAGFLLLMLLFTLLSRAADQLTIPRAVLGTVQRRSIERKVKAFGKAEELSAQAVDCLPGLRVAGIAVKPGARVARNEPLITLDRADVEEKLAEARKELERMDMDLQDQTGRAQLAAQDQATAVARANQDYAAAEEAGDRAVAQAAQALEDARAKLNAATPAPTPDPAPLEEAVRQAEEALSAAREEVLRLEQALGEAVALARAQAEENGGDPDEAEAEVRAQYQPERERAQEAGDRAERELSAAREALEQAKTPRDPTEELRQAAAQAQQAYDQAVESREAALRQAARAVEDANRPAAPDSTAQKARLDRDEQARLVSRLEALLDSGCVVRSPAEGVVTGVQTQVGAPTPQGTALLLAVSGGETVFTAQAAAEQEKYLSPGDPVTLDPGGGQEPITGLTLDAVAKNGGDPSLLDLTVRLPPGTLEPGATAELTSVRQSREYPACVPLSALHEDGAGGYYLLAPREADTILGRELTAARLSVEVLEKNETYAALDESALSTGEKFISYADKALVPGDRIRLEEP